jgi:hypothetical protein
MEDFQSGFKRECNRSTSSNSRREVHKRPSHLKSNSERIFIPCQFGVWTDGKAGVRTCRRNKQLSLLDYERCSR